MSVTPPKPQDELIAVASRLSRAAPTQWAEFMKAFDVYSDVFQAGCIQAKADEVLVAQGRARQCVDLLALFTKAQQK